MVKKDFTKADAAIDKMFIGKNSKPEQVTNNTKDTKQTEYDNNAKNTIHYKHTYIMKDTDNKNITKNTNIVNETNIINDTKITNKSKHYDKRGPRKERFGLLLDERLKEELTLLSKVTDSKSVNDLIVTVLVDYVEKAESQIKLERYKEFMS